MCGIVYVSDVDETGNISNMKPLIVGGPYNPDADGDKCDVNNLANPDSVFVDGEGRLWIGEDTSYHVNNVLWMWDGEKLNRFATVPRGAEVTGFFAAADGALFFNAQHPSGVNLHPFNRGVVGVVNGFKATDDFEPMPVPTGADQHRIMTAAGQYQVLARVGEMIPNDVYGHRHGQINTMGGRLQQICNSPDGNMWLPTAEDGSEGYLYTNYECQPGAVGRVYIRNNGASWDVLEGENVDFSSVKGTWNNCGASVTPWNTGLTAEEYEPFATQADWKKNVAPMTTYLGEQANPYDYGWLVEVSPDPNGDSAGSVAEKRYAMGRFSHEMGVVLPDGKTVYNGDDGTNVVLFKFVADEAGDLSAGTLYAAKVTQNEDQSLDLEWIELGSGNDDEIAEAIDTLELPN
jgi:secreted PhoX family phosphatase